jgi:hypothetical protein
VQACSEIQAAAQKQACWALAACVQTQTEIRVAACATSAWARAPGIGIGLLSCLCFSNEFSVRGFMALCPVNLDKITMTAYAYEYEYVYV